MILVFIGHLFLAVAFIVGLYIGATYSSILYEINEIKLIRNKIEQLLESRNQQLNEHQTAELMQQLDILDKKIAYYKNDYNETVKRFYSRKTSVFAVPVLALFKKLDQDFAYWN